MLVAGERLEAVPEWAPPYTTERGSNKWVRMPDDDHSPRFSDVLAALAQNQIRQQRTIINYNTSGSAFTHYSIPLLYLSRLPARCIDMSRRPPSVAQLQPSRDLLYDHHGPSTGPLGLTTSDQPLSFHNPWPSYRFATLSDAWRAYQRGAAVAPAQRESGCCASEEWSRVMSRTNSRVGSFRDVKPDDEWTEGGGLFYDPDDDDDIDPEADWGAADDGKDDELDYIPKKIEYQIEPVSCYVRPDLKRIQDEDDDDDWREPPVYVMPPRWMRDVGREGDRGEKGMPKPSVTWLGHASVLIQIPFRDGSGNCSVLFDPIFSNRCSPVQYVGPARYLDPPCSVAELPPIHLVIISHDHCELRKMGRN